VSDQTTPSPEPGGGRDRVSVRRAPRFGAFLVVGGFLGFVVTLILTSLFEAGPAVGFTTLLAYFSLYGITAGVLVGALIAIIVDRRSRRRMRTIEMEREIVAAQEAEAQGAEAQGAEAQDAQVQDDDSEGRDR